MYINNSVARGNQLLRCVVFHNQKSCQKRNPPPRLLHPSLEKEIPIGVSPGGRTDGRENGGWRAATGAISSLWIRCPEGDSPTFQSHLLEKQRQCTLIQWDTLKFK